MLKELEPFKDMINLAGEKHSVDPKLIGAIIMQESHGKVLSYRFEPKVSYIYTPSRYAEKLGISFETEINCQHTSWGTMQIMGFLAREIGYDDHLPLLLMPSVGIDWGSKALSKFVGRFPFLEDTIAAYNAGSPRKIDGKYVNQAYVDSVKNWYKRVENG